MNKAAAERLAAEKAAIGHTSVTIRQAKDGMWVVEYRDRVSGRKQQMCPPPWYR